MIKIVQIPNLPGFAFKYTNWRLRPKTNEERYEGYMRSDFSAKPVETADKVEVVRI